MNFFKPKFWDKNKTSFLSILLFPFSLLIIAINFLKEHLTKTYKFSIPVICIGNIYLGGTGKTPLCIEIFSILKSLKMKPAFVKKKYNSYQDETKLLNQIGPVYESHSRVDAIKNAIENNANIVVLDDGFQDFSVKKNFSIICFNSKQWIGNGFTIPSGPLRETLYALKRASCIIINGKKNIDIEKKIFNKNPEVKIFYVKYNPQNINEYINKKVIAFAGIGNPDNFFELLNDNNINVIEKIKYPDHYQYSEKELKDLLNKKQENIILLTTEKDYFRIPDVYKKDIKCVKIEIEIENKSQLIEEIKKII